MTHFQALKAEEAMLDEWLKRTNSTLSGMVGTHPSLKIDEMMHADSIRAAFVTFDDLKNVYPEDQKLTAVHAPVGTRLEIPERVDVDDLFNTFEDSFNPTKAIAFDYQLKIIEGKPPKVTTPPSAGRPSNYGSYGSNNAVAPAPVVKKEEHHVTAVKVINIPHPKGDRLLSNVNGLDNTMNLTSLLNGTCLV